MVASTLLLVLDVSAGAWRTCGPDTTLEHATSCLMVLVNAHLALREANTVVVVTASSLRARVVYPASSDRRDASSGHDMAGLFIKERVLAEHKHDASQEAGVVFSASSASASNTETRLSAALALALCHANRLHTAQPRVLVVSASPDASDQYLAVMNCLFSAQKLSITVDAATLGAATESRFLQQAAELTGGVFHAVDQASSLLPLLLTLFLPDAQTRPLLVQPPSSDVDFRAACFCCQPRKPLALAYVCSVCLSTFCKFRPICSTCNARFPFRHRASVAGKRKRQSATAASASASSSV